MEENETQEFAPVDGEDVVESTTGDEDSTDWKAEALKYKAIAERKDKKLQQIGDSPKLNKINTDSSGLTREEAIFFAKGGDEEGLKIAKKIADLEGISLLAAMEDDYYKSSMEKKQQEKQKKLNSLSASNGSPSSSGERVKPVSQMTRDEHMAFFNKRVGR